MAAFAAALSAQAPRQTFRTTTRLVEVSVVVTDKAGNPVPGLGQGDFTISEDGVRQTISIFQVNDTRGATAVAGMTPAAGATAGRTFTNKVDNPAGSSTVILLDRLNAAFDSQWFARKHVNAYLETMRPGDRVALYVLDGAVRVLHDFTTDRSSLRLALEQYTVRPSGHYDASNEPPAANPDGGVSVWLADPTGNVAEFFAERRVRDTFSALRVLARHLSGVAGRKGIVWISEAFTIPAREGRQEFLERMRHATQALSDAQVALYPVDARGLVGAISLDRGKPAFTTFAGVRGNIDTMRIVAEETGGRAFANSNALDASIRQAVDDSRLTYVLGYYPADVKWDGRFRPLSVKVNRSGLIVRHRRGYLAGAAATNDPKARDAALREAFQGPLQSTTVGLSARAELGASATQVTINLSVDPSTITLDRDGGTWRGAIDVLIADVSPKGLGTINGSANLDLTLTDEGRAKAMRDGLPITRTVPVRPGFHQLRVIVRDVPSGHVGSLLIPASQLK